MDLVFNSAAPFTRWIVRTGVLREPFVVVDVGVQGGENPRWHLLGDHLVVHGFDPILEVIETLKRQNAGKPSRHYHWLAAGNSEEVREFYFNATDLCSSSLYSQGQDRFQPDGTRVEQSRQVQVRRLDGLLADGTIPPADFLKVDVEGFEQEVFAGAGKLLETVLGVETETNFGISPTYPKSHFVTIHETLLKRRLLTFDLNFNRIPRATFQAALERKGLGPIADNQSIGKPATLVVLFCRDLIAEVDQPQNYPPVNIVLPSVDTLIKTMVIYELHGLSDIALDTAVRFSDQLGQRFDVSEAIALLADPTCRPPVYAAVQARLADAQQQLAHCEEERRELKNSTSWRITAPLRAIRRSFGAS
jgi:FkbM family methyltransferase